MFQPRVIGWTSDAPLAGAAKTGAGGAFDDGVGVGVDLGWPFFANPDPLIIKKQNPRMKGEYFPRLLIYI